VVEAAVVHRLVVEVEVAVLVDLVVVVQ